jgi:hypothetical protein
MQCEQTGFLFRDSSRVKVLCDDTDAGHFSGLPVSRRSEILIAPAVSNLRFAGYRSIEMLGEPSTQAEPAGGSKSS